ncbi:MAG: hypothetical protein JWP57_4684 [Spirosoma sp.]|nr:hypothetical protein [Spirosoma sp.]
MVPTWFPMFGENWRLEIWRRPVWGRILAERFSDTGELDGLTFPQNGGSPTSAVLAG